MASPALTYQEFWHRYLRAHARPQTRALHYAGTALALACFGAAAARRDWRLLLAAPAAGYGLAFTAHFTVEGNRPETFGYPVWSFASDLRMFGLFLAGRLGSTSAAPQPTPRHPDLTSPSS